jgi:hypothetical protein
LGVALQIPVMPYLDTLVSVAYVTTTDSPLQFIDDNPSTRMGIEMLVWR